MDTHDDNTRSHLFLVRLWDRDPASADTRPRGRVQHILSSEVNYFEGWPELVARLETLLDSLKAEGMPDNHKRQHTPPGLT